MPTDPIISHYLQMVMFKEIVPFAPLPEAERCRHTESIMERFANPHIRHELISIMFRPTQFCRKTMPHEHRPDHPPTCQR